MKIKTKGSGPDIKKQLDKLQDLIKSDKLINELTDLEIGRAHV